MEERRIKFYSFLNNYTISIFEIIIKNKMILFFIQIRKVKHNFVTIYFYNEEEKKKGSFIAIISM
jgi:hypothetical protein